MVIGSIIRWPNEAATAPYLRNSTPYRGWPEYTANLEDKTKLILLGNSQAVGIEFPRVDDVYPSKVYDAINYTVPEYSLHNWSVVNLLMHQLELLSIRALETSPELLIVAVSLFNFNKNKSNSLSADSSDIPLLLGETGMWPDIINTDVVNKTKLSALVLTLFQSTTSLGRWRIRVNDFLAQHLPRPMHRFALGSVRNRTVLVPLEQRQESSHRRTPRLTQVNMTAEQWSKSFKNKHYPQLNHFYESLKPLLVKHNSRLLWIWMPFVQRADTLTMHAAMSPLQAEFCQRVVDDGWDCHDLSKTIDSEHFISSNQASHLSRQGHKEMAELLTPLILRAVH